MAPHARVCESLAHRCDRRKDSSLTPRVMSRSPDVIVIGGGIAGLCTALAAAERGLRVTAVDDGQPGAASRASAGMLAPCLPGLPASLRNLALAARDLYPQTVAYLAEVSGVDIALDRGGILEIATSRAELEALDHRAGAAVRLEQRELAELEPALGMHAGAVHHPLDGWVDNRALMDALHIAAERHPQIHLLRDRVTSVDVSKSSALTEMATHGRIGSPRIVLATGAWASLLPGLPRRIPVRPVKGELLTLNRSPVRHVVYGHGGYLVPRGASVLVGATSDEADFDPTPTTNGRTCLVTAASALVPSLSNAEVVDHWGGLRPVSLDGLPLIGEDPECPALVYACGFSRNGVLFAPWAGNALAAVLAREVGAGMPGEFDPMRFVKIITTHDDLNG
jgi:glycine oxidase